MCAAGVVEIAGSLGGELPLLKEAEFVGNGVVGVGLRGGRPFLAEGGGWRSEGGSAPLHDQILYSGVKCNNLMIGLFWNKMHQFTQPL